MSTVTTIPEVTVERTSEGYRKVCPLCGWKSSWRRRECDLRSRGHSRSYCNRQLKHQAELAEVHERFPSTQWGENEWYLLFKCREDVFEHLLNVMGTL